MTFVTLIMLLGGLALLFSSIENLTISDYLKQWIGGK